MSGTGYLTKGTAGVAATTSFFGAYVPDRYNSLVPGHNNNGSRVWDNMIAANNVAQWTPWNTAYGGGANAVTVTVGAAATAPDGTSTANHIAESTTNSFHQFEAIGPNYANRGLGTNTAGPTFRLSVFAKAAERTRCVLYIHDERAASPFNGMYAVYDLANGVVAVGPTQTQVSTPLGYTSFADGATIVSYGNGWYRCTLTIAIGNGQVLGSSTYYDFQIDNGTGNAALSNNYVGNGTSGLYVWRSVGLPPDAWALGGPVYNQDFDGSKTVAQIFDTNNTKQPGFEFYVSSDWRSNAFSGVTPNPSPTNNLSISGSVLTIGTGGGGPQGNPNYWSAAPSLSSPFYVGSNVYTGPALFETKMFLDLSLASGIDIVPWWTTSTNNFTDNVNDYVNHITKGQVPHVEMDFADFDNANGASFPICAVDGGPINVNATILNSMVGFPFWVSTFAYGPTSVVWRSGQVYTTAGGASAGQDPLSGAPWSVYSISSSSPILANSFGSDFTQFNVYTMMWFPASASNNHTGQFISLFNGILSLQGDGVIGGGLGPSFYYGATFPPNLYAPGNTGFLHPADVCTQVLNLSSATPGKAATHYDYIRVVK